MTSTNTPPTSIKTYPTISELRPPLPVPKYGSKGTFGIYATRHINAPAHKLLKATLAHNQYSKWNSFVPDITINSQPPPSSDPSKTLWRPDELQPGTIFTVRVYMDGSGRKSAKEVGKATVSRLRVDTVEELSDGRVGFRVVWRDVGRPDWCLRVERVQEFVDVDDGGALYTTWETLGGPLALLTKLLYGRALVNLLSGWGAGLKEFVEDS